MLGEIIAKTLEATLPARLSLGDPLLGRPQRRRLDTACSHPPGLLRPNQAARLQHSKVLEHRRKRHGERPRELADRRRTAAQSFDHDPSRGIGKRLEEDVDRGHNG